MEIRNFDLTCIQNQDDFKARYRPASAKTDWTGRWDGDGEMDLRWHQHVTCVNVLNEYLEEIFESPLPEHNTKRAFAIIGFACDEGVKRNLGRTGSSAGPQAIRKALGSIPVHKHLTRIVDLGTISCEDGLLENAQVALGDLVCMSLRAGLFPIVLGGGHEITYGHALGIQKFLRQNHGSSQKALKIFNIDAHFDNREPGVTGPSSGTGFYQLMEEIHLEQYGDLEYFAYGIQKLSNTARLFERAHQTNSHYLLAEDFQNPHPTHQENKREAFFEKLLHGEAPIYVTIDMDVFASPYAPGVSAPSILGIVPDALFFKYFDQVMQSDKVISVDFAELNPTFDIDQRTAKLVAALIFRIVNQETLSF